MLKRSVVIKARRIKPLKLDYQTIILFTLFLCGLIIGIAITKNGSEEWNNFATNLLSNYISTKSQSSFLRCFSGTLVILLLCIFIDFLFGLCAVGTPFVWLVPLLFGCFCGCGVSCLLINYGLKGLCYCALVNIPCYAITAATLIKCCCESTKMSVELFTNICGFHNANVKNTIFFKEYVINYLVLCVPIVIGALISTVCFKLFSSLFIFI